jgi:hypothetical protein
MEPTAVKLVAQSTQMAAAAHAPVVRSLKQHLDVRHLSE